MSINKIKILTSTCTKIINKKINKIRKLKKIVLVVYWWIYIKNDYYLIAYKFKNMLTTCSFSKFYGLTFIWYLDSKIN